MVSSDPDIAENTAAAHGPVAYEALDAPLPTDELRERMRLRLAKSRTPTQPPIRTLPGSGPTPASPWPSSAGSGLPIIAGGRGQHGEVGQLVWNSVLDSLATSPLPTADPVPTPPGLTSLAPAAHQANAPTLLPLPSHPATPALSPAQLPSPQVAPVCDAPVFIGAMHDDPAWIVPTEYGPAVADPTPPRPIPAVAPALPPILVTEAALHPLESGSVDTVVDAPQFTLADLAPIVPAMPVLAPLSRAAPSPQRPMPSMSADESALRPTDRTKKSKKAGKNATLPGTGSADAHRHKKRHPIRSFLSFVLIVGLLSGAGYAGWYKFLRKQASWAKDLRPAADFVESTVHRPFDENVTVTTLSAPEYEVKLGIDALSRLDPTSDMGAFRAVGLIDAAPSAASIGRVLAPLMTAFYRVDDHTIYRLAGDTPAFEIGVLRAMTVAIVDQDIDLAGTLAKLDHSQRVGFRAMIDGVANLVVRARFAADPDFTATITNETNARLAAANVDGSALPSYLADIIGSAEVGSVEHAMASIEDPMRGLMPPASDAQVFDPAAGAASSSSTPTGTSTGSVVLGVEFWYDTLAPAIGPDAARTAALRWTADTSSASIVNGQACLSSTITTAGPEDQAALRAAFDAWAQTRPTSTNTTIGAGVDGVPTVAVSACSATETGQPVPTSSLDEIRAFFTQTETEHQVVRRIAAIGAATNPPSPTADRHCIVAAVRAGAIPDFRPVSTDPQLVAALGNVAAFCSAPRP